MFSDLQAILQVTIRLGNRNIYPSMSTFLYCQWKFKIKNLFKSVLE